MCCAAKNYVKAVLGYTRAIDLDSANPIYYANRAFAHLRLENAGLAMKDATKAIELDPAYAKVLNPAAFPFSFLQPFLALSRLPE